MMNVPKKKLMKVTSLTGKHVSTDNSKVIGEEARARLEVLGSVRGCRVFPPKGDQLKVEGKSNQ